MSNRLEEGQSHVIPMVDWYLPDGMDVEAQCVGGEIVVHVRLPPHSDNQAELSRDEAQELVYQLRRALALVPSPD